MLCLSNWFFIFLPLNLNSIQFPFLPVPWWKDVSGRAIMMWTTVVCNILGLRHWKKFHISPFCLFPVNIIEKDVCRDYRRQYCCYQAHQVNGLWKNTLENQSLNSYISWKLILFHYWQIDFSLLVSFLKLHSSYLLILLFNDWHNCLLLYSWCFILPLYFPSLSSWLR